MSSSNNIYETFLNVRLMLMTFKIIEFVAKKKKMYETFLKSSLFFRTLSGPHGVVKTKTKSKQHLAPMKNERGTHKFERGKMLCGQPDENFIPNGYYPSLLKCQDTKVGRRYTFHTSSH